MSDVSLEIGTVIIVTSFPPTLKMWKCFTFALKTGEEIAKLVQLCKYHNTDDRFCSMEHG